MSPPTDYLARYVVYFLRENNPILLIRRKFDSTHFWQGHSVEMRRKTWVDSTSLLNGHANDVGWRKELHHAVLNFLSLKSRMTSVHRSQKPRTSDAMSTRRPCFSPLNLPGILHLFASHLRITNYQRTCRTLLISVVPVPPSFSTSSSFLLFIFFCLFVL